VSVLGKGFEMMAFFATVGSMAFLSVWAYAVKNQMQKVAEQEGAFEGSELTEQFWSSTTQMKKGK
jgi:hypothetical protein